VSSQLALFLGAVKWGVVAGCNKLDPVVVAVVLAVAVMEKACVRSWFTQQTYVEGGYDVNGSRMW
jgi:hypothetical protein